MENLGKNVVWLINEYGTIPENGYGGRVFYLAKYLVKMGFTVYFIVARNHHLISTDRSNPKSALVDGVNVVSIKTLNYSRSNSMRRIVNWFVFNFQLGFVNLVIQNRPDFIFASSPSPFVGIPLVFLSKIYSSKSCFDVRDVWPATLSALGNMRDSSLAYKVMAWVERFAIKHSDIISSNLPNFPLRIMEVLGRQKKFMLLPNGYDPEEIIDSQPIEADLDDVIPSNKFLIGYIGSIGLANALEYFLESAGLVKTDRVCFVVVGDGEKLNGLKNYAQTEGLKNIVFIPKVTKKQVAGIINKFDVCFVGWRISKLYNYGIAPNKIPEYLISGKPVLHSFSGSDDPISRARAGITVCAEDPFAIARAIEMLESTPPIELENMGLRGRQYAISHYSYETIAQKLASEIMA